MLITTAIGVLFMFCGCSNQIEDDLTDKIDEKDERIHILEVDKNYLQKIVVLLENDNLCWEDFDGNQLGQNAECEYAPTRFAFDKLWCFEPVSCK